MSMATSTPSSATAACEPRSPQPAPAAEWFTGVGASAPARIGALLYGLFAYAVFFVTFLYAYGWVGNLVVPRSIDSAPALPFWQALAMNVGLLALFSVQHSVMARPTFKRWWTRFVPACIERSTYVLLSSVCLILLFILWSPMGGVIWDVQHPVARTALYALFTCGWALVFVSTLQINHFDLFGLRQVWLYFRGRDYTTVRFRTPMLYRRVRHPLYVGWIVAFWATPTMTVAHLLFASLTLAYILVAIRLEERNLADEHGESYRNYRRSVPMLIPRPGRTFTPATAPAPTA